MQINEIKNIFFNFLKQFKNQNDIFVLMNYLDLFIETYKNDYSKYRGKYISFLVIIKLFIFLIIIEILNDNGIKINQFINYIDCFHDDILEIGILYLALLFILIFFINFC